MSIKQILDSFLYNVFKGIGMADIAISYAAETVYAISALAIGIALYYVLKWAVVGSFKRMAKRSGKSWFVELMDSTAILKAVKLILALFLYRMAYAAPLLKTFFEMVLVIYIAFMAVSLINSLLDAINTLYIKHHAQATAKPIKGMLTVAKFVIFSIAFIIVLSKILGQSPVYILTGLGALSAVTMLIFKDSILGFVAGFQMSSNDLVRIGDWIEMPKYGADGDVIDISLTFVKVRNWDKTIVTIPAYALVSDSFKNWRGMFSLGGRRIKRAINIDVSSVGFCSDTLIKRLSEIEFIKDYLQQRQSEIDEYNQKHSINVNMPVNGRHLTNLGVFRVYVMEYLKRHPKIHKDMLLLVRQLQNENTGIPLEIYAFTNDTKWVNYEEIMADIFDHLYAAIGFFDLKAFQEPSGNDIRALKG